MKKFERIQSLAILGLMGVLLAVPFALGQSAGTSQANQKEHRAGWGGRGNRHGREGGRMLGRMMRGLNLTDAQKAQIKQIGQSFRNRTQPLRQELRAKRQELHQANQGGAFNEALASQKLTEMAGLQAKLMGEQFKLRQEMLAVLTPEQRTQLEQRREQFKSTWAERHRRQDRQ